MGSTEARARWPLRRWLIVVLPFATVVGLFPFAVSFGTMRHAQRVTAQEANDRLHQDFRLPLGATNVDYFTSVKSSHVTLDLSLDDLMKWCDEQQWRTREIGEERPAPFRELNAVGSTKFTHLVSRGLEFGDRVGDLGFWGVYDSALGRASVSYISN